MQKRIKWNTGTGYITLNYNGQGDGPVSVTLDDNTGPARSQEVIIKTVDGSVTRILTIRQSARPKDFNSDFNSDFG